MALGINNITSAFSAKRNFSIAQKNKNDALEKLSSGLKINKGSDNPAGLLISELLRSQLSGLDRALRNTQETNNVLSIAEGGLSSVSSMLTNMRGLAIHALNSGVTSGYQVQADQMEMNSLLSTINRVVDTTSYAGNKLLNGAKDFTFETSDPDNILVARDTSIASANGSVPSSVAIGYAGGDTALQAEKAFIEADFGAAATAQAQEFTVSGLEGAFSFSFAAGTSVEEMAERINSMADSTGVNAYAVRDTGSGATMIRLASTEYGSDASVRVDQHIGDAFSATGGTVVDYGQDATVSVNGQSVITDGLTASVAGSLNATVKFAEGDPTATGIAQTGYDQDTLTDAMTAREANLNGVHGGMQLQLGETSGNQSRDNISLGTYNGATLGRIEYNGETYSINDLFGGGAASLAVNPELALKVIDQAISDVASGRANIGAYQANALDTNANNLMVAIENTTATESGIRDADIAELMTLFVKNQLLENSSLKGLQSANMNAGNVLQLLGGIGSR